MKIMKYLLGAAMALAMVGCDPFDEDEKEYIALESIVNTLWYSYDQKDNIFYDITYGENNEGTMLGYSEQERVNEVVNRPFTYTFTPATAVLDAVVRVDFEDGQHYGGIAIPKGHFQISLKDVFFIQLYEVDANGEVIYDINGNIKSTLQMWME